MEQYLVITFTGADRPGIVDTLASVVREHGANWEASRMASLAGRFAGILEVRCEQRSANALVAALSGIRGLELLVDRETEQPRDVRTLHLAFTGQDRPGIVKEIAHALASRGVNIEEMNTDTRDAPMGGGTLFDAEAEITAPDNLTVEDLRGALERIAADLMVEIELERDEG